MDRNKLKLVIACLMIIVAGVLVSMQMGLFGGSAPHSQAPDLQGLNPSNDLEGSLDQPGDRTGTVPLGNTSRIE